MRGTRLLTAAAVLSCSFASPTRAWGEEAPAPAPDPDDVVELGEKRVAAADTRAGHLVVAVGSAVVAPAGSLVAGVGAPSIVGVGPSVTGLVGFGVGRHVTLELDGSYAALGAASSCPTCAARFVSVGAGVTYHLAQGIALDPWARFGVGYRHAELTLDGATESRTPLVSGAAYHGLDVAKLALGADFYPTPWLGFGPFLAMELGTLVGRPATTASSVEVAGSVGAFFLAGVRVALDPMRKAPTTARAARVVGAPESSP